MRRDIHQHYKQLTDSERRAVDDAFRFLLRDLEAHGVRLVGDDRAERAIDAVARAVIESRDA